MKEVSSAARRQGSMSRRATAVGAAAPIRSANAAVTCRASAGVLCSPGTEWAMARRNRPRAGFIVRRAATEPAPADTPPTVTRPGSPPKAAMLRCTHSSAAIWSRNPRLGGASSRNANPSAPTRQLTVTTTTPASASAAGSNIGSLDAAER